MSFFNWAVERERNNCKTILVSQKKYVPKIEVRMAIQPYGVGAIKSYYPHGIEKKGHLFSLHGGGLIAGSIEQNENFCLMLTEQGYTVHSIEYPLIPEVTFERQVASVCDMIAHVSSLIKDEPKYLIADSAGCLLGLVVNALLSEEGYWMRDYFGYKSENNICHFNGIWFNCPLFETVGFNKVGIFMAKGLYGKNPAYKKFLRKPYKYFVEYLPKKVVIVTSPQDDLKKQAMKLFWEKTDSSIYFGERKNKKHNHDWNILYPDLDEWTINMNAEVLRKLTK